MSTKVTFKGREIELRDLTVLDGMRLAKVVQVSANHLGIDVDEIKGQQLTFKRIYELAMKIIDGAFGDFDLEQNRPGEFATMVFTEFGRLVDQPMEEILTANQSDFMALIEGFWKKEAEGPFVQKAGAMIQPLLFPLFMTFAILRRQAARFLEAAVSIGGAPTGGEFSSSFPSLLPLEDGESERSSDWISDQPSPTSEEQPSGVS